MKKEYAIAYNELGQCIGLFKVKLLSQEDAEILLKQEHDNEQQLKKEKRELLERINGLEEKISYLIDEIKYLKGE